MEIRASWSKIETSKPDPTNIVLGYLTNEPPHGSAEAPVLIDLKHCEFDPEEVGEINLFLEGMTAEARELIDQGMAQGYRLVPRDDRQMPAPRINMKLRIAPGTEGGP